MYITKLCVCICITTAIGTNFDDKNIDKIHNQKILMNKVMTKLLCPAPH